MESNTLENNSRAHCNLAATKGQLQVWHVPRRADLDAACCEEQERDGHQSEDHCDEEHARQRQVQAAADLLAACWSGLLPCTCKAHRQSVRPCRIPIFFDRTQVSRCMASCPILTSNI